MKRIRKQLSVIMAGLLVTQTAWAVGGQQQPSIPPVTEQTATVALAYQASPSLDEIVKLPSFEIAALAEKFSFDAAAVAAKTEALKKLSKQQEGAYKTMAKSAEKQVEAKEHELSKLPSRTDDAAVVCNGKKIQREIVKIRKEVTDQTYDFLQKEVATDVELARMNLLANWGSANRILVQKISAGTASQRLHGNVLDIGNRSTQKPFKDQEDDTRWRASRESTRRASRTSFFATHSAYGDGTLNALKEYKVLHSLATDRTYLTDTSEFQGMKERLRKSLIKTPR